MEVRHQLLASGRVVYVLSLLVRAGGPIASSNSELK